MPQVKVTIDADTLKLIADTGRKPSFVIQSALDKYFASTGSAKKKDKAPKLPSLHFIPPCREWWNQPVHLWEASVVGDTQNFERYFRKYHEYYGKYPPERMPDGVTLEQWKLTPVGAKYWYVQRGNPWYPF